MNKTTEALKLAEEALVKANHFHDYEAALVAVREAFAEQEKQRSDSEQLEPVGVISESAIGLVKLHANGVSLPFGTPLYAASVSAEAIRAEALEEAAKVCEEIAPCGNSADDWAASCLNKSAKAIRSRSEK